MTTIAPTMNGSRPVGAPEMGTDEVAARERGQRLSRGQTAAVAMSIALGMVVAGYGLAGAYLSISNLAAQHDVPLAGLVPAGIDGGLVAVVVLDLVLTWIGLPGGCGNWSGCCRWARSPPTRSPAGLTRSRPGCTLPRR